MQDLGSFVSVPMLYFLLKRAASLDTLDEVMHHSDAL